MSKNNKTFDCKWCHENNPDKFYGTYKSLCERCQKAKQKIKRNNIDDIESKRLLSFGYIYIPTPIENKVEIDINNISQDILQVKQMVQQMSQPAIYSLNSENMKASGIKEASLHSSNEYDILITESDKLKKNIDFNKIELSRMEAEILGLNQYIDKLDIEIKNKNKEIEDKNEEIKNKNKEIEAKNEEIKDKDERDIATHIYLDGLEQDLAFYKVNYKPGRSKLLPPSAQKHI